MGIHSIYLRISLDNLDVKGLCFNRLHRKRDLNGSEHRCKHDPVAS